MSDNKKTAAPVKKIWSTPEIYLLATGNVDTKGVNNYIEIHNALQTQGKTPGGVKFYINPSTYNSAFS